MNNASLRHPERSADTLTERLALVGMVAAGGLIGFGVVLWVAANWSAFAKFERFALIGGVTWVAAFAAFTLPRLRIPASLIGILSIGGLLALVGQTYQSDADAWTLFALWAGLALPWAVASRHDSVWLLWNAVAYTALSTWMMAQEYGIYNLAAVLPAWCVAGAIALVMSPRSKLARWMGGTRWSHRLAVILTLILIMSASVSSTLFVSSPDLLAYIGLLALAAIVAWFACVRPFDLPLLAASTLALDIQLISFLIKFVEPSFRDMFEMLFIGLLCAGIVGVSAVAMLTVARRHRDEELSSLEEGTGPNEIAEDSRSWPVVAVSAVGAVIAAIPIMSFVGLLFGSFIERGPGTYLIGAVILSSAVFMLSRTRSLGFLQMLSIIFAIVGGALITYAFYRDMPVGLASLLMMALMIGIAAFVPSRWVALLCGLAATGFMLAFLLDLLRPWLKQADYATLVAPLLVVVAGGAAALAWIKSDRPRSVSVFGLMPAERVDGFLSGWTVAGLLMLSFVGGRTFLLSGAIGLNAGAAPVGIPLELSLTVGRVLSGFIVAASLAWLFARRPALCGVLAYTLAGAVLIMSYLMPALGGPVAALAIALSGDRRILALIATICLLWIVGSFYYWLGLTLLTKAYILVGLGLAIGVAAFIESRRSGDATGNALFLPPEDGWHKAVVPVLVLASALGLSGVVGTTIRAKEDVLNNGRKIFVALAPVDPRSLVQGDFMRLRFALPAEPKVSERAYGPGRPKWAIAVVDNRAVATVTKFVPAGYQTAASELLLKVRSKAGRLMFATDSFFFEEGTGKRYEAARFGELRVDESGYPILVGLTDENLKRIE